MKKKLVLPNVTLFAATSVEIDQTNFNLKISSEDIDFAEIKFLSSSVPSRKYPDIILGLSDHTPGHATVLGAVTLGARVIEKHFTNDTKREGPDHKFSMDFNSWKDMVDRTRELESALGVDRKKVEFNEKETIVLQRRSIRTTKNLEIGDKINEDDLDFLRPCPEDALPPYELENILNKELIDSIKSGDHIKWKNIK